MNADKAGLNFLSETVLGAIFVVSNSLGGSGVEVRG
jgi:hypothetical protein